ncbi:MAG: hypothetical protein EBU74_02455 [Betaproteobacteria bacterium]|nr:hypothetical protein [Betaproteobacteria bacterium]
MATVGGPVSQTYSSLTVGYSDSEDRLWLRLVRDGGEAKFWMTQRLAIALLDQSYGLMIGSGDAADLDREHHVAVEEFVRQQGDQAPPRDRESQIEVRSGLITSINVSAAKEGVAWTFVSTQGSAIFQGSRTEAHRLLEVFWRRIQAAGWRQSPPWNALSSQASVTKGI